jgi:hypothetical protein
MRVEFCGSKRCLAPLPVRRLQQQATAASISDDDDDEAEMIGPSFSPLLQVFSTCFGVCLWGRL